MKNENEDEEIENMRRYLRLKRLQKESNNYKLIEEIYNEVNKEINDLNNEG